MNLTDLGYIRSLCDRYGFNLSKGFGQNFIVNSGICPKIVDASGITKEWGVLEIGPGIGVLTQELAKRAKKVVAIEVDTRLPILLKETLADFDNIKIITADVLKCDLKQILHDEFGDMPVAVCANLPYYITSPILMKLLEERLAIEQITVMVQKEAAQRICAECGTREAGAISYAVHYYSQPQQLFNVQPGSFYPPPRVTSAVIRLKVHKSPPVLPCSTERMFMVIKAAFSQRRKTAANSISSGLACNKQDVISALLKCGKDVNVRPEQLTLEDYAEISNLI